MSNPTVSIEHKEASRFGLAIDDLVNGLRMWRLWGRLGWSDVVQKYRRSLLGPFWLTASMAIMIVAMGLVYSQIFKVPLHEFMPFLCVGLMVWGLISTVLLEAGSLFTGSESYIKQIRLPYSVYVLRFVWSKLITFAHNFVVYFAIILFFQVNPGFASLFSIFGFALILLNSFFTSIYLGMISARFRDIPQIVASVVQILFFITPIIWKANFLGKKAYFVTLNPFYHLVEIARAPLLGELPSTENYLMVIGLTCINAIIALAFFSRFRSRIPYWV
ncbi:lipopolysaccharide transport system permease protein [Tardiphaga sp. OK246]|uniref:ABC transporter permease n=1 Tax=Tardiphaga sp. OK246 TaxID=1855307 RepID=UPI000B7083AC|nr:ABC transporter permease [Tardiphaga sp. OK246]SNT63925.1 lipopolysaccharide transport system permease protein [Tardiphaga sp. OK246]